MERVFHKFNNFEQQEDHEILEYVNMTVDQRMVISRRLKKRAYGIHVADVREYHRKQ